MKSIFSLACLKLRADKKEKKEEPYKEANILMLSDHRQNSRQVLQELMAGEKDHSSVNYDLLFDVLQLFFREVENKFVVKDQNWKNLESVDLFQDVSIYWQDEQKEVVYEGEICAEIYMDASISIWGKSLFLEFIFQVPKKILTKLPIQYGKYITSPDFPIEYLLRSRAKECTVHNNDVFFTMPESNHAAWKKWG